MNSGLRRARDRLAREVPAEDELAEPPGPRARALLERFAAPGRLRLIVVTANGQPAFASYVRERDGTYHAHAVTLPTLAGTGIARIITFRQPGMFGPFGLPQEYSPPGGRRRSTGRSFRGPAE